MSDNHHELCPKCGLYESDGTRCNHCAQLVCPLPAIVCPACGGIDVGLIDAHHHADYPLGHCKLFRCGSCEWKFTVKLSADEEYKVPPKPPTTVMLSSGIVLSVDEAKLALEEIHESQFVWEYGNPADRDAAADRWIHKYFPK